MKTMKKRNFDQRFWRWPIMMFTLLSAVIVWAADPDPSPTQEGDDPENPMVINTQTADCPTKCVKSNRCDKMCRSRVVAEQQMIEKIQSIFAQSLQASQPAQMVVIDQSRFCPREVIQLRTPAANILSLANLQGYKGSLSEHTVCTGANGYTVPAPPPPVQHPAYNYTDVSADGCIHSNYVFYPKTIYEQPVLTGSVKFQCSEDEKTKTMSWKMTEGCKIHIPTRYDVGAPSLVGQQNHCPPPQPPTPPGECTAPQTREECVTIAGESHSTSCSMVTEVVRVPCGTAPTCAPGEVAAADANYNWVCQADPCYPNGCQPPIQDASGHGSSD